MLFVVAKVKRSITSHAMQPLSIMKSRQTVDLDKNTDCNQQTETKLKSIKISITDSASKNKHESTEVFSSSRTESDQANLSEFTRNPADSSNGIAHQATSEFEKISA